MAKAIVLIKSDLGAEKEIVKGLKTIPNVTEVYIVYGAYDIIVIVGADSMENLRDTITYRIRELDKIRSTLSMIVADDETTH